MSWDADAWEGMGTGNAGVVINDGYTVEMPGAIELELRDQVVATFVQDDPIQIGLVPPTITEIA